VPVDDVVRALADRFGAERFDAGLVVRPEILLEALRALRDQHGYRYYVCATATDRADAIEVLHGVRNLDSGDTLFVKVKLPKEGLEVESAAFLYVGAEWQEREIWDLFGVVFRSHPDLRRLLMPDDYDGHPLRKEFPIDAPWGYRPATRPEPAP